MRDASLGGLKGLNPSGFLWGNRSVDVPKNRPPAVPTPSGGLFLYLKAFSYLSSVASASWTMLIDFWSDYTLIHKYPARFY